MSNWTVLQSWFRHNICWIRVSEAYRSHDSLLQEKCTPYLLILRQGTVVGYDRKVFFECFIRFHHDDLCFIRRLPSWHSCLVSARLMLVAKIYSNQLLFQGECKRGEECPYRHEKPTDPDDPLSNQVWWGFKMWKWSFDLLTDWMNNELFPSEHAWSLLR